MQIRMQTPDLDPMVRQLVGQLKNKLAFVKNWANSAAMEARNNARAKGGRRYWRDLARSIQVQSGSESAVDVGTDHKGAALKQYGGEIRPVNAKALTIPIAPEAKDRSAYDFERSGKELFVVSERSGDPATVGILGYAKSRKNGNADFQPLFALRTRVIQQPDRWFPESGRIDALARREAELLHAKEQKQWTTQK